MRLIFIILWIFSFSPVISQTETNVLIKIFPPESKVLIDGETHTNGKHIQLTNGPHQIKAWSPNMSELVDTILVMDSTKIYSNHLKYGQTYLDYFDSLQNYKQLRVSKFIMPWGLITASAISDFIFLVKIIEYKKELKNSKSALLTAEESYLNYLNATSTKDVNDNLDIYNESYQSYTNSIDKQNSLRGGMILFGGTTVLTNIAWVMAKSYYSKKLLKKPKFVEIKTPVWIK